MKVWIVMGGWWEDAWIEGVWASEELAEKHMARLQQLWVEKAQQPNKYPINPNGYWIQRGVEVLTELPTTPADASSLRSGEASPIPGPVLGVDSERDTHRSSDESDTTPASHLI